MLEMPVRLCYDGYASARRRCSSAKGFLRVAGRPARAKTVTPIGTANLRQQSRKIN